MKQPFVRISGMLTAIAVSAAVDTALAQTTTPPRQDYGHYHGHGMFWGDHMGGFGLLLGPLFMIIVVIAIAAAVVFLIRAFGVAGPSNQSAGSGQSGNRALDILKERFARGEIDAEEFNDRKRQLSD